MEQDGGYREDMLQHLQKESVDGVSGVQTCIVMQGHHTLGWQSSGFWQNCRLQLFRDHVSVTSIADCWPFLVIRFQCYSLSSRAWCCHQSWTSLSSWSQCATFFEPLYPFIRTSRQNNFSIPGTKSSKNIDMRHALGQQKSITRALLFFRENPKSGSGCFWHHKVELTQCSNGVWKALVG